MSFTVINTSEIATGQGVSSTVATKIKDSLDNHETRIGALESTALNYVPLCFEVTGDFNVETGVLYTRIAFNINLTAVRLIVPTAGSAGTTEIEFKYSRSGGAFTTIFSTKPSVAYGAGNMGAATNGVFSVTSLLAGDILRLDTTSRQTGSTAPGYFAQLEIEQP